jgi:hypothetical protein
MSITEKDEDYIREGVCPLCLELTKSIGLSVFTKKVGSIKVEIPEYIIEFACLSCKGVYILFKSDIEPKKI